PILVSAAAELGVADAPGFPAYAVSIGKLRGVKTSEVIVDQLGLVLMCAGIVFTGPVGLVVVGALDVALSGTSFALTYMRERQQDVAAAAGGVRAQGGMRASAPTYADSALAGAAALVSTIAFVHSASDL